MKGRPVVQMKAPERASEIEVRIAAEQAVVEWGPVMAEAAAASEDFISGVVSRTLARDSGKYTTEETLRAAVKAALSKPRK